MQIQYLNNVRINYTPVFKAQVTNTLIEAIENYCEETGDKRRFHAFNKKVNKLKFWNNDNTKIIYEKSKDSNGKRIHSIYLKRANNSKEKRIVLLKTNCLRELLEQFLYFDKQEFNKKIKNILK